jgi:hypothetical protein
MLITCFLVTSVFSQANLNSYKYIIVAKKFDFLNDANQYRLNELAQFLFEKYGFEAIMEGEDYPEDLLVNRCLGLKADVLKDSGMFKTRLTIELKDCNDKTVYTSGIGESRQKDYSKAYTESLRNSFKSIEDLDYKYVPNQKVLALETPKVKNEVAAEIQQLKEEIQNLKKEKEVEAAVVAPQPKVEEVKETLPMVVAAPKPVAVVKPVSKPVSNGVLYAQAIENGFQLVDNSPKVVYKIKKTGIADVFMVENKSATIYKKGDRWILEYYENNELKQEVLNIKF